MNIVKSFVMGLAMCCTAGVYAKDMDKNTFEHVIDTIRQNSLYKLTDDEIYRGALQGVMRVLEEKNIPASKKTAKRDEFSWHARNVILNPEQMENLVINTKGSLTGVGISLSYNPEKGINRPVIIDVLEGGGRDAGLKNGDQLLKINGRPVDNFESFENMIKTIRGPAGSEVKLTLLRGSEIMDYSVTRRLIKIANIQDEMLPAGIAYLKILYINDDGARDVARDLQKFLNRGVTGLILDLREERGGLYDAGKEIISLFVKKGDAIYLERRNTDSKPKTISAKQDGIAADMKVVVLVSENTASIGEALTSIFKYRDHSVVMGTTTFGKASIEDIFDAGGGYKALITVGMLYNRNGETWHGVGIKPDIAIPGIKGDIDNVLELARDYIQRGVGPR